MLLKPTVLLEQQTNLIQSCIDGDRHSQSQLYELFVPKMFAVCLRYSKNREEAEEILQEGFVQVFKSLKSFRHEGSFEGWVRKIMVNTALKKYSLRRYEKEVSGYEIKDRVESAMEPSAYAHLTQKELMDLINKLPDGYRMIFNLYVIEGYQHDEIAEMLGIQPGTSRSQLVKARNMLQKQILQLQKVAV